MIDHQDNQTQPLPLDEQPAKRGRGRPGTGQALSNAERQRLYRERQKAQRNEKAEKPAEDMQYLADRLAEAWAEVRDLKARLELAEARANAMGNELAITKAKLGRAMERKSSKLGQSMQRLVDDMHEVAEAVEGGSTWRIQKKKPRGTWKTQAGSYWQLAKAEDALLDLPKSDGAMWRIIEVKSELED